MTAANGCMISLTALWTAAATVEVCFWSSALVTLSNIFSTPAPLGKLASICLVVLLALSKANILNIWFLFSSFRLGCCITASHSLSIKLLYFSVVPCFMVPNDGIVDPGNPKKASKASCAARCRRIAGKVSCFSRAANCPLPVNISAVTPAADHPVSVSAPLPALRVAAKTIPIARILLV